jgi:hypothetical protein
LLKVDYAAALGNFAVFQTQEELEGVRHSGVRPNRCRSTLHWRRWRWLFPRALRNLFLLL